MSDGLKVTIAGLEFYGQGNHPFIIEPDGFTGWDDGVDMRTENTPRPGAHGSFDLPGYQDSRTVSVSGTAFADGGPRDLAQLRNRFTATLAGGQTDRIQVERYGEILWAPCKRAAKPTFQEHGGLDYADYQMQVWCPDPLKYGRANVFTASMGTPAEVSHRGTFDAAPSFVINGDSPAGYTLTIDGHNYRVNLPLVPGQTHRVDFSSGLLYVNGSVAQDDAAETILTNVPPGKHVGFGLYRNGPTGSGTAVMEIYDTYI